MVLQLVKWPEYIDSMFVGLIKEILDALPSQ
jgi:hypothetical protein